MTEQERMDRLLRQSMGALPSPALSAAFDRRLAKRLRPRRLGSAGRLAMTLYAVLAFGVSVCVMQRAGVSWIAITIAIVAPLTLVATVQLRKRLPSR
jgi:hypothetical protein